ncbi:lipopolysaccharide biosynthesis protein [Sphingobacterium sp. 1.A.4]|uniref:lipopolysaccharide biosynthesis protein n=1 Tax=Sphingobacterium sp. 1.A.4 TaxID=2044603 RepID=UPI000C0BDAAA|nr:lipopolysaccharide biosynthesis protein [Sphingobacterium sp. 1.A.4]
MASLKKEIIRGSFWTTLGQISVLGLSLLTNIWLARLLSPIDFGRVGIIMFFISIGYVLSEGGLSGALIRKKVVSEEQYSTVSVFNLIISIGFSLLIISFAGSVSKYYNDDFLKLPLIISSLIIIINAFQFVKLTQLYINLNFKDKAIFEFISVLISSIIAIVLAYNGAGIWSIVLYNILRSLLMSICLYINNPKGVGYKFNISVFKDIYGFGVNTSFSSVLTIIFDNIYSLILGKYFNLSQVGYYFQARRLLDVPSGVLTTLSNGPIYSGLSKIQDNKDQFSQGYIKTINILMAISGIMVIFVYLFSDDIILIIFGNKWIQSVIYLKILSLSVLIFIQDSFNKVIFKIYNKTRTMLKLDLFKKGIQLIGIGIAIYFQNINVLLINYIISLFIGYLLTNYYSRKILNSVYYVEQRNFIYLVVIISILLFGSDYFYTIFNKTIVRYLFFVFITIPVYAFLLYRFKILDVKSIFKGALILK